MKRLLICSRSHMPHGGADRIIADLCRHLPGRGWEVRLGLTQGARFNDVGNYLDVLGHDLPAVMIDGRIGTRGARVAALRQVIRQERPDVVLSMRVFDAYEAVIREKSAGAAPRLAVGIRSFEAPYLADLALYKDSVDLCITSGELLADLAVQYCGLERNRVVSIGGGVHPAKLPTIPRQMRQPLALLYAGRLDEGQKRIADLPRMLDVLDRLGISFRLHIAGSGPADAMLQQRLAARIASGEVQYHGWVSHEQLYQSLYPQADVFLHFAGWEGMTIAPREAMAHGVVPVISQFQGLLREGQFVDGVTALTFPIGDVEAAAASVQRLYQEDGLLTRLSTAAVQSQRGPYSFDGAMDAWAEALERSTEMPALCGELPIIQNRARGRMDNAGVPESVQTILRKWLRRPVRHQSPGSEWPTASGTVSSSLREQFELAAHQIDRRSVG